MMDNRDININEKSLKENKSGFLIPENYLNDFESKILSKIGEEPKQEKAKVIGLKSVLVTMLPVAAILVLGYFLFVQNSGQNDNDLVTNELSWDEYASFDESWIVNELSELKDEQDSDLDLEIEFLIEEGVTTNEIIEYYKETL